MPKFIALPVGQGDAFFIETCDGCALIDGGRSAKGFADLFTRHTRREGVDILVATHNDADHANGVLGFLQSGLQCKELWLPGRWAQVMQYVLRPGEEVVYLLARQVQEATDDVLEWEGDPLEQYAERIGPRMVEAPQSSEEIPVGESGWPEQWIPLLERASGESGWPEGWILLLERASGESGWPEGWILLLERASEEEPLWELRGYLPPWLLYKYFPRTPLQWRLFASALIAAKRIRQIALEAYHRGIPVRWFEHDPASPSGGTSWLKPLSARQMLIVKPLPKAQFLFGLALTTWNKESLVLWATPGSAGSGVLFTADSDLQGMVLPAIDGAIVTAPHHGSEDNKAVYQRVAAKITGRPPIWIRSDGKFRSRPCREYLSALGKRFCTICRNSVHPKQSVSFFVRSRRWVRGLGIKPCSCT